MEFLTYASNIIHYAISFFIIISIIVFVHEFGHFFVARLCGVKIDEFSIGFGKEIVGWYDKRGTRWKISILPFGGFVKMHGDATEASTPDINKIEAMSEEEKKYSFHYKNVWQKMAIVAAGPTINFLFAIVIIAGIFMTYGKPLQEDPAVINEVAKGSAAEEIGLKQNDKIIELNGTEITRFAQLPEIISMRPYETLSITYIRDGQTIKGIITPKFEEIQDSYGNKSHTGRIGISPVIAQTNQERVKLGPIAATTEATSRVYKMARDMFKGLKQIITGVRSAKELGGPVRILEYSGQSTNKISESITCAFSSEGKDCGKMALDGLLISLLFMAMISTSLGLLNLFPIPMLDGGHMLFYLIEVIFRRKPPEKIQEWSFRAGFAFIITLMIYVSYNNIVSWVDKLSS